MFYHRPEVSYKERRSFFQINPFLQLESARHNISISYCLLHGIPHTDEVLPNRTNFAEENNECLHARSMFAVKGPGLFGNVIQDIDQNSPVLSAPSDTAVHSSQSPFYPTSFLQMPECVGFGCWNQQIHVGEISSH